MSEAERPLWDARYRVVRTLGSGGMGRVLLAEDVLQGGRALALKRMVPESLELVPTFLREFRIHRQLAHPNIPRAYELGFALDQGVSCPYFTMEIANGVPLMELMLRYEAGLPLRAVMQIVTGLLRALDHVHRLGWVHGDLKPGNVLVSERAGGLHVHLIDFGVALPKGRTLGDDITITPEYAAPELLEGSAADERTDLYAVGLLLFEMLENRRPWFSSDVELLYNARTMEPVPALTATSCPPALAAIVRRLLARWPQDRPGTAAELLTELTRATGWDGEIEPPEAFIQRLLTIPLPWRTWLEGLAARVTQSPVPPGEPWAVIIDVPMGFFARRLLGPVLDEAAARRARILPVRFEDHAGPASDTLPALAELHAAAGDADERLVVYVIENLDAASPVAFEALARGFRGNTRVVATRRDPRSPLPPPLSGEGVMIATLERWSDEQVRGWLHRALGRIGAPWERAGHSLGMPPTPAAIVESLANLHRQGKLVRAGDGYLFRDEPQARKVRGSVLDPNRRLETLDALLACVKAPVPEAVLPPYLGAWSGDIPELLARGVVLARGDGTVHIADEPRRATLYGRLTPQQRHSLHRRLAQALEEVAAPAHRIAEEWLDSDAPLLAVPHLLAAAEARPGRSWLPRAMALIQRARSILTTSGGGGDGLELWRYEALVLRTHARVLLACGKLDEIAPLVTRLVELGTELGHRYTIHSALEIRLQLDLRHKDWEGLVRDAASMLALEGPVISGVHVRPGRVMKPGSMVPAERPIPAATARLNWARALRFRAEGSPTAALAELEAGISALSAVAEAPPPQLGVVAPGGEAVDVMLLLLEARAELCLDVQWRDLAEEATVALVALGRRTGRPEARARARILEVMRLRMEGRIDKALASATENAEALPRERTPTLDALVELELGWCRFELGELDVAFDHARCAATLAQDEGSSALMARAAVLEATAAWYLGRPDLAWRRAQEAVRAGGAGADSIAVNARLLVLELALAMRGFAAADEIMREASEAGWRAQRRLERAREARAFRLAAEAALIRREPVLALQHAEHALSAARAGGLSRSRYLVTIGQARLANGAREAADLSFAEARSELLALAATFADAELRERWLAHPDQRGVLGKRSMHSLA